MTSQTPRAEIVVESGGLVRVKFTGRVRAVDVDHAADLASAIREPLSGYIIDCLDVDGFDSSVTSGGKRLLEELKQRGAARGVCATASLPIRMTASAVAFVAGAPVRFTATLHEARAMLDPQQRK